MEISEVIEEFRSQVADQAVPFLFSDTEILRWLVDAQDMFVRGIGGIADGSTTNLIDVSVIADEPFSSFSPYILRIRSGRLLTAQKPVEFIHEADLELKRQCDYGFQRPSLLDDTDTGVVSYGILGITDKQIRWYKVPETDDICRLHIFRLPFPRIVDEDDEKNCLEIDEQYHLDLILWMKHKAYSKEDAETYDKTLAENNKRLFDEAVEVANKELGRQRFKPKQVRYGGIPF